MKFKIVKCLDNRWGQGVAVDYVLSRWGERYTGGEGWCMITSFKTEQEAMDFAKQYQAVREEKEFTL